MNDTDMTESGAPVATEEPLHAGYSRFELELEVRRNRLEWNLEVAD